MKREIEGRWWLPEKPDEVFTGTLHFSDEHQLELIVKRFDAFSILEIPQLSDQFNDHPVWFGADEGNRPISVFHCAEKTHSLTKGLLKRNFICSQAFIGKHVESLNEATFAQITIDFSFLQEWLNISSIRETEPTEHGIGIVYRSEPGPVYPLKDGSSLHIQSAISTIGNGYGKSQWHVTEHHCIALQLPKPESIAVILKRIKKIRWLLSLLMAYPVHLTKFTVGIQSDGPHGSKFEMQREVEILGSHLGRVTDKEFPNPGQMLLSFSDVSEQFGNLLNSWLDYFVRIEAVFNLYFAVVFSRGLYINHQFLLLAQALEVYHRTNFEGKTVPTAEFRSRLERIVAATPQEDRHWVREKLQFANEKTLSERLHEILARYPKEANAIVCEPEKFATDIRNTRNYYTHFADDLRKSGKVADHSKLVLLTDRMKRLLEMCFLRDLGLQGKAVLKIVNRPSPEIIKFEATDLKSQKQAASILE